MATTRVNRLTWDRLIDGRSLFLITYFETLFLNTIHGTFVHACILYTF
jgi:hypothetical protein